MSFSVPVPSAGPSAPPLSSPVVVVSSQFLAPYPVDLVISEKLMTLKEGSFAVSDVNGDIMFSVKGSVFSLHDKRVLVDSAGTPIVTFRQKVQADTIPLHSFLVLRVILVLNFWCLLIYVFGLTDQVLIFDY